MGLTGWELGGIFVRPFEWNWHAVVLYHHHWHTFLAADRGLLLGLQLSRCGNSPQLVTATKDIAATHAAMMSGDLLLAVAAFFGFFSSKE